tara:strand:+ start:588 stop:806 length:219 start_codon:yes stop_codon:yes gene_type:complete
MNKEKLNLKEVNFKFLTRHTINYQNKKIKCYCLGISKTKGKNKLCKLLNDHIFSFENGEQFIKKLLLKKNRR